MAFDLGVEKGSSMGDQRVPVKWRGDYHPISADSRPASGNSLVIGASGLFVTALSVVSIVLMGFNFFSVCALGLGCILIALSRFMKPKPLGNRDENQMNLETQESFKELKRYIGKTRYLENVQETGEGIAEQLKQVLERYKRYQELLEQKFNPSEITFSRYLSVAQETFLALMDNLHKAATLANNLSSMDYSYLENMRDKATSIDEYTLSQRKAHYDRQLFLVRELLAFNEKAITEIDKVSVALAEVKTRRGLSDTSLESAMADLTKLAHRAKKYSFETMDTGEPDEK